MLPLSPSLADERAADYAHFLATATAEQIQAELDYVLDHCPWEAEPLRDALCDRFPPE